MVHPLAASLAVELSQQAPARPRRLTLEHSAPFSGSHPRLLQNQPPPFLPRLLDEYFGQRPHGYWSAREMAASLSLGPAMVGSSDMQGTLLLMQTLSLMKPQDANRSWKNPYAIEAGTRRIVAQKHQRQVNRCAVAESL
jgi:hypothetical protein